MNEMPKYDWTLVNQDAYIDEGKDYRIRYRNLEFSKSDCREESIRDRLRYTIDNFITGYYDFSTCGGDTAWKKGYNNQKDQI